MSLNRDMNVRFKHVYDYLKSSLFFKTQEQFGNLTGFKQGFISAILNKRDPVPTSLLHSMSQIFPFLGKEYIRLGIGEMIRYKELSDYLRKKHSYEGIIPNEEDLQYTTNSDLIQETLNFFNSEFGYNLTQPTDLYIGDSSSYDPSTKTHIERNFIHIMEHLIDRGRVSSVTDFAHRIGLTSHHPISNIKSKSAPHRVTISMAVNLLREFPFINPDYLLLNAGDMYRTSNQDFRIQDMQRDMSTIKETVTILLKRLEGYSV